MSGVPPVSTTADDTNEGVTDDSSTRIVDVFGDADCGRTTVEITVLARIS